LIWGHEEFGSFSSPQKVYMDEIKFVDVSINKTIDGFGVAIDQDGLLYTWGLN